MRILLQTYAFLPSWGGVQKFVLTLYQYLRGSGIKTAIVTSSRIVISEQENYHAWPWTDKKGTQLKRFNFSSVRRDRLLLSLSYFRYCCFLFWFRPRIVHLIFLNVDAWFAVRAKKRFDFKLLTSCRGSDILRFEDHNRFRQQLITETLQASDAITAVSHEIAGKVRQILNSDISVSVIPNGVDLKALKTNSATPDSDTFVYVGHLDENKNPEFLLRVFVEFCKTHSRYKLKMIGTGPLLTQLQNLIERESVHQSVELMGGKHADDAVLHIQKAIALIITSKNEGCPNVVLEAMSAGTPVIGSNRSGIKELIRNGYDGLLFEYNDPNELSDCLEKISESRELRSQLAQNAFQTLREKHNRDHLFQQYITLYENLLAS